MFWYNRIKRAQKNKKFIAADHDASTWHSDAVAEIKGLPRDGYTNQPLDMVLVNLARDLDDALAVDATDTAFYIFNQIQERTKEIGKINPGLVLYAEDLTPWLENSVD